METDRNGGEATRALVVDRSPETRERCVHLLWGEGFAAEAVGTGRRALEAIPRLKPSLAVIDLEMPDLPGLTLLERALEVSPETRVIATSEDSSVLLAIQALRAGAWQHLPRTFSPLRLNVLARYVARGQRETRQNGKAPAGGPDGEAPLDFVGESPALREALELARRVAPSEATVLLSGESGTGKARMARFIHERSAHRDGPLVYARAGGREGPELGSLAAKANGASRDGAGGPSRVSGHGNGGTLFLEEIQEMPRAAQGELVALLRENRLGRGWADSEAAPGKLRVVAAMSLDAAQAVEEGKLRADLLHHLMVVPIELPPLRERGDDIGLLARHFLEGFWRARSGAERPVPTLTDAALATLERWPWHGNVRELKNVMERTTLALPREADAVDQDDLRLRTPAGTPSESPELRGIGSYFHEEYHAARSRLLADFEQSYVRHVMRQETGNVSGAARRAGIDRATLYRLLAKHGLRPQDLLEPRRG